SSTLIPQPIQLSISISGATSVGVNNPTQTVAWVQKGLTFSATGFISMLQCTTRSTFINLKFTEGFASAFKAQGSMDQSTPGVSYNTESGLTPVASPSLGYASQGTRLWARITGIPDGTTLAVPGTVTSDSGYLTVSTVEGADTNGAGGSVSGVTVNPTISDGTAMVVYEVTTAGSDSIGSNETVTIPVKIIFAREPSVTTGAGMAVRGNLAPLSTITTAADVTTATVPRFQDTSSETGDLIAIAPCRTLLLFPYVTNAAGFDTGIAISNTSKDPFERQSRAIVLNPLLDAVSNTTDVWDGSTEQSGACELNYYGAIPAIGGNAPAAVTTPQVGAGEQLAFIVSSGGSVVGTDKTCDACATPGFHGYIIAICNFQYAHGFAFVSDQGSARLAEGYLALVIPDPYSYRPKSVPLSKPLDLRLLRYPRAFSASARENAGEQLVY
ncbi:MAG: hypothetical protein ABFD89_12785, partial [Bryobacteraceae bacterium]